MTKTKAVSLRDLIDLVPIVQGQGWTNSLYGSIRNSIGQCPLCAMADDIAGTPTGYYTSARSALFSVGLFAVRPPALIDGVPDAIWVLMLAADTPGHPDRKELEHALGMPTSTSALQ